MFRSKPRNTRSYKGRPESNLPGNDKAETHPNKKTDAVAPPLAGVKGQSAQAPGQQKKPEPAQNGKSKGQQGNSQAKTNGHAGTAGLNGIAHRSDRANEVAQNTHKNPHLVALGLGEGSEGTDGGTTGGDTGEATNPGQCDTLNAGCTAGEAEEALYTGDEIVIIGDTKEQQFYYHPDHLGSTAYITDSSGQLTEHLEYFPFGETWVQEGGSKKTPYLYTGKELDQETGLYYYGARYYDPRVSIWASPDPILEKYLPSVDDMHAALEEGKKYKPEETLKGMGGVYNSNNLGIYTYTHNNPIIYVDPDGNAAATWDVVAKETGKKTAAGWAVALGEPSPAGEAIMAIATVATLVDIIMNNDNTSDQDQDSETSNQSQNDRDPKQDKKLSKGEIKKLQGSGEDVHELKGGKNASKKDLFKDRDGNVYVKPKDGSGPGEPTGINLNEL